MESQAREDYVSDLPTSVQTICQQHPEIVKEPLAGLDEMSEVTADR